MSEKDTPIPYTAPSPGPIFIPASLTDTADTKIPLRAWLAGQALAGYMATVESRADVAFTMEAHAQALGGLCVRAADAVIAELDKEKP